MTKERKRKALKKEKYHDNFFLYKINNLITERNLLQPNQRILIGVSGGQDSICLLKILYHLKKKWNWKLGIVHCDHRWNSTSKFQAAHVAYLAVSLQIDYHQGITIDFVQKEGIARIWRYHLIQTVAISNNYTAVVTGHTASDRIETLLYNLTRGSGLHGLQSISWKRSLNFSRFTQSAICRNNALFLWKQVTYIKAFDSFSLFLKRKELLLIRPLLETTRTEIRNLLTFWKFPSWPDKTNKDLQISRNRIRHRLVPYLRIHYNPKVDQTLARWTEIVQNETFYLEQLTRYLLLKIEIRKQIIHIGSCDANLDFFQSALHLDLFRSLPLVLQRRILKQYIYKHTGQFLGFQYIEQIRLSCFFRTLLSSNVKKKKFVTPWIIFPKQIKLLITKKYLFIFYQKSKFKN